VNIQNDLPDWAVTVDYIQNLIMWILGEYPL